MIIIIPKETEASETRVAVTPNTVKEYIKIGATVKIEQNAGKGSFINDDDFINAGAEIFKDKGSVLSTADVILKVSPINEEEIQLLKSETISISFFQPTLDIKRVKLLAEKRITAFSMHLVPRTTLAQKMDALSSQANIAG